MMRSIKTIAVAAGLLGAAASLHAQAPRPFHDSWFWGVTGGMVSYSSADPTTPALSGGSSIAPAIGADWLITRQKGGLYLGVSQAFVTTTGAVLNGPTSADTGFRAVDVKNLRRVSLMGMAFPGDYLRFHPYIGFGFTFGYLGAAAAQFTSTDTQKQVDFAASAVNDTKASIGPAIMAGAQYRLKFLSVFGQFSASALSKDFLLANGNSVSTALEFGLRYNIGSSIDRQP
jgi:hypothetical protein